MVHVFGVYVVAQVQTVDKVGTRNGATFGPNLKIKESDSAKEGYGWQKEDFWRLAHASPHSA